MTVPPKQLVPAQSQDGPENLADTPCTAPKNIPKRGEQTGTTLKSEFNLSLAVVIGINQYGGGVPELSTATNDAKAVADILQLEHGYEVVLLIDEEASATRINHLLREELPNRLKADDRLLFYFAGHGIALNGEDGPAGYLLPHDAKKGDENSYMPMADLQVALSSLSCRHFLGLLDCCFAGAFRWSSTRDIGRETEKILHQERYDRFIKDPAWQVIPSAASDQTAADIYSLSGERGHGKNSPFAAAFIEALKGKADAFPVAANGKPAGDGVITANELYMYLRDSVEFGREGECKPQTPGIFQLKKHDKGEYVFLVPGHPLNLPPAPPLDESKNPYRGLESFEEEDSALFFGRTEQIESLYQFVSGRPLTVVLGASGSGKSSLVKAGLVPKVREREGDKCFVIHPFRPGNDPFQSLISAQNPGLVHPSPSQERADPVDVCRNQLKDWFNDNPNKELYLIVDQLEELVTLCSEKDRDSFLNFLTDLIRIHPQTLRVVLTVRNDFESQFSDTALKDVWKEARFVVKQMSRANLREAIEKPAEAKVMYFEPHELVEKLIDEVADMPGSLPLLSFGLSELYLKYLKRFKKADDAGEKTIDRSLTLEDYNELGGVNPSLTQRADSLYDELVNENPAYEQIIRQVMLRMVAIGGGELARRQVPLSELEYPSEKNELALMAIDRFTNARLLVKGNDSSGNKYVEPAHDALVRGWQKLLKWKREDEESLPLQRRLTPAAQQWERENQKYKDIHQTQAFLSTRMPLFFDWLDRRLLFPLEDKASKVPKRLAHRFIVPLQNRVSEFTSRFSHPGLSSQNEERGFEGKPVDYLWTTDPHLAKLYQNLSSHESWLNQLEAEFVTKSTLQKRKNLSWRWRIVASVFIGLSGLTLTALWQWQSSEKRRVNAEVVSNTLQADEQWKNNNELEALVSALKAVKQVKQNAKRVNSDNRTKAVGTLQKIITSIRQRNILEGNIIAYNSNDKKMVTGIWSTLKLWNATGNLESEIETSKTIGTIGEVTFASDGIIAASGISESRILLTDSLMKPLKILQIPSHKGKRGPACALKYNYNSHNLLASRLHGGVFVFDLEQKNKFYEAMFESDVTCSYPSPDSRLFASHAEGGTINLNDLSGRRIGDITLSRVPTDAWSMKWSPSSNSIAYIQDDQDIGGSIKVIDLSGRIIYSSESDKETLSGRDPLAFSPDGRFLAYSVEDGVAIYDLVKKQMNTIVPAGNTVYIAFSSDGEIMATSAFDGFIKLWNWSKETSRSIPLDIDIADSQFTSDSNILLTLSESSIFLWDRHGRLMARKPRVLGNGNYIDSIAISPDNQMLAYSYVSTGTQVSTVILLNLHNNNSITIKGSPAARINRMSFSFDSGDIVFEAQDKTFIYNLKEQRSKEFGPILGKPSTSSGSVTFGPLTGMNSKQANNHNLFMVKEIDEKGLRNSELYRWNWRGDQLTTIKLENSPQPEANDSRNFPISISSDGMLIAQGDRKRVSLWNNKGKKLDIALTGHTSDVTSIEFLHDGKMILTADERGTVKLWNLEGRLIADLATMNANVQSVKISPDSKAIAIITRTKQTNDDPVGQFKFTILNLDPDSLLVEGCSLAQAYLNTVRDQQLCADIHPMSYAEKTPVFDFFFQNGLACQINNSEIPVSNPGRREEEATCTLVGKVFNGSFLDNQFLGREAQDKNQGLRIFRDGSYCVAPISKGELNGQGECWLVGKQHYKGSFANGKFDGMGILTNNDGSKFEGLFKNDKPVQALGTYQEKDAASNKPIIKKGLPCKSRIDKDCP